MITTFEPESLTFDPAVTKRFWDKVKRRAIGVCWEWLGAKSSNGYGNFRIGSRNYTSNRLAFILSKGEIPAGLLVCHKCDNKGCCNPAHLFLGSYKENIQDARSKGHLHGPTRKSMVIEIGVDVSEGQLKGLQHFLRSRKIAFYIEPPRRTPYYSLEELEADCEGK